MSVIIIPLTRDKFEDAVRVVLNAQLDTREEIEHHLKELQAHYVAQENNKVVGVIGWYQDKVDYASSAMGDKFPGEEAYWVGFFAVDDQYRGKGVGYSLLQKLEELMIEKGVDELWVSSVPETVDYYQREGFERFMEGKISGNPKVFMVKRLNK